MGTRWKELSGAERAVLFARLASWGRETKAMPIMQPYVEQHERDKERAAADKQAYDVR
jgi:hypothetical protein